jgi:antitoxin HicB
MKNKHVGSPVDDFLKEEGLLEESQAVAIKRVLAYQIERIMEEKHLSKKKLTEMMKTKSRTQIDRILDPDNASVTLYTLDRIASALGKKLEVQMV